MNHIEIELRYQVLDKHQLPTFLGQFEKLHQKHDVDVYLDNPEFQLYKRGIFIRLRNHKKLDFKFNRACLDNPDLEFQDYCEEHSFAIPLQEQDMEKINDLLISLLLKPITRPDLDLLKSINNFGTHYIVNKLRTSYKHNSFTLCVDEVMDLGTFLEIELMANSIENLKTVKIEMQQLLKGLSLEPVKIGYCSAIVRKQNFELYLLGRFLPEEDKIHRTLKGTV